MNQGKLVILFIFGLSILMGGYAWWHHFLQGRRSVELWGAEAGELIRYAPRVDVLRLDSSSSAGDKALRIQGRSYLATTSREITGLPGLVHARQALIEDASFLWNQPLGDDATWSYAMHFQDRQREVVVAFDVERGYVRIVGTERAAVLQPHLRQAYASRLPLWLNGDEERPTVESTPVTGAATTTADTP